MPELPDLVHVEAGLRAAVVADLYKADPPLLVTAGEHRQITAAGRARLAAAPGNG